MFRLWFHAILLLAPALTPLQAQPSARQSTITIHVHKSGLFAVAGHNHTVVAPVSKASIDPQGMTAEIVVLAKEMKVTDTDVSDKDRAKIQADMLGPKVLNAEKFPQIRFTSVEIKPAGAGHLRVTGMLELHGVSKQITLEITGGGDHYQGKTKLKQSDFGIEPFSAGGGTIKVKDELDLDFDIYAESVKNAGRR
ncbi:MAG TPA: YceI family protein [Candidatus Angelobacter sp.]